MRVRIPEMGLDAREMQAGIGNGKQYPPEMGLEYGFRQMGRAEISHEYDFLIPKSAVIPAQSTSQFSGMFTKF